MNSKYLVNFNLLSLSCSLGNPLRASLLKTLSFFYYPVGNPFATADEALLDYKRRFTNFPDRRKTRMSHFYRLISS